MSRFFSRMAFMFLCMASLVSCSNMIEWVEFHHNADIERIESTAGQMRACANENSAYTLSLTPTNNTAYLRVTPENPDARISIRVDSGEFVDLPAGTYSQNVAPTVGSHVAEIHVTSPSGKTVKTYIVRVMLGETVRANRLGVYGYESRSVGGGSVGGTVQLRITSADRSMTVVTATILASDFASAGPDYWVYFSFPETEFYRGMEYRIGLNHDQGLVNEGDPCVVIPFRVNMFYRLLHDDVYITSYSNTQVGVWVLNRNEWLDASTFVVP